MDYLGGLTGEDHIYIFKHTHAYLYALADFFSDLAKHRFQVLSERIVGVWRTLNDWRTLNACALWDIDKL